MINDQVLLALIVAVPAVIAGAVSPVIMLTLTGRRDREAKKAEAAVLAEAKRVEEENRRYDKEEIHAREDAVARRAAENAQKMLDRQDTLANKATEAAEVLALNTELAAKN